MDRFIAIRESTLVEMLDLTARALDQLEDLQPNDALNHALKAALAEVVFETFSMS